MTTSWYLTHDEKAALDRDGYVVRPRVFDVGEVAAITAECESLVAKVVADRRGARFPVGSYTFELDPNEELMVKWEGDSDVVHGLEPLVHHSELLAILGLDPRLVHPMVDFTRDPTPMLYTEKLNLKRPRHGGRNPLHQDLPYWADTEDPTRVATAMVFLNDADLENGTLEVVPGSHKQGLWQTRIDGDAFAKNEIDQGIDESTETVALVVPAGTVVYFGSSLPHRSGPNTSDRQRRSLLYSYQPSGWPTMRDQLRETLSA